jgi:uncharacterized protein (TIGR03086 family)
MIDLAPASSHMAALLAAVDDDQLHAATPLPGIDLGGLVDHVMSAAVAFTASARKDLRAGSGPPPEPDAANLRPGWREQVAADLAALAEAWSDPRAWEGTTTAGGVELSGEEAGIVALDELVLHGWDVAVASGQPYVPDPLDVEAATSFVEQFDPSGTPGLFGPSLAVDGSASALDRLLARAGRDPRWSPGTTA